MTLSKDIQELFDLLLRIPANSRKPDDMVARDIIMRLLRRRIASARKVIAITV